MAPCAPPSNDRPCAVDSRPEIDSRRWTGPEPEPLAADRRAARGAFLLAGGRAAGAPQRTAAAVSWLGLAFLPAVVLAGADDRSWLPGLQPVAAGFAAWLEAWLVPALGADRAKWIVGALGDPRLLAVLVALGGGVAGMVSAWRHRAALAQRISLAPGPMFSAGGEFRNHIRLTCGQPWSETLERAVQTLARLVDDAPRTAAEPLRTI